mgnify:CR=1 FL=1
MVIKEDKAEKTRPTSNLKIDVYYNGNRNKYFTTELF